MFYIYCYTNLINGKKYVGQTNNINQRQREHKSAAFNSKHKDYNQLFHKKIRQYGLENFSFEVLEEINTLNKDEIDKRESFWINKMNSFVKNNQGYNVTTGGQGTNHKRYLSEQQINGVINDLLNTQYTHKEIAKRNKVSLNTVVRINNGYIYKQEKRQYPLRQKYCISENIKIAIAEALVKGEMTRQQIADLYGVSLSTVKRIKSGETKVEGYNFPLKKPVSTIEG